MYHLLAKFLRLCSQSQSQGFRVRPVDLARDFRLLIGPLADWSPEVDIRWIMDASDNCSNAFFYKLQPA